MIMWIVRAAMSLFGFSISPVLVGALIAGAITIGIGVFTLNIYNKGKAACEYGHLLATIAEQNRQIAAIEQIAKRDAARAAAFEEETHKLQEKINATPINTSACLPRDSVRRIRSIGGLPNK